MVSGITIYLDDFLIPVFHAGELKKPTKFKGPHRTFHAYDLLWGMPKRLPIFAEMSQALPGLLSFTVPARMVQVAQFFVGYAIRSPGCSVEKFVEIMNRPTGTLTIQNLAD